MSQHEYQNKRRKKWHYVYRKFGITQKFNIEDTKAREKLDQSDGSKKSYIWRDVMKAVTFCF